MGRAGPGEERKEKKKRKLKKEWAIDFSQPVDQSPLTQAKFIWAFYCSGPSPFQSNC
jgi:hypothetical protein